MTGKFVIRDTKGGIKFGLRAGNNQVVLTSDVYSSIAACRKGIESIRSNAPAAAVEDQTVLGFATEKNPKFEIYLDKSGGYRFRLKSKNGQTVGTSEVYKAKPSCKNGIESVKKNAPDAVVIEEK